jgi:hypothetical protein
MLGTEVVATSQRVVTVTEVLDRHVALHIQCPTQVVAGCPITR